MKIRNVLALVLALVICLGLTVPAFAVPVSDAVKDTASYIQKTTPNPQVGSIGG